jgi:hypothetical protein
MGNEEFRIVQPDFTEFTDLYKNTLVSALDVMGAIVDDNMEKEDLINEIQSDLDNTLRKLGGS